MPRNYTPNTQQQSAVQKCIAAIALYRFAHPTAQRGEIVAQFCTKLHKSKRTVEQYYTDSETEYLRLTQEQQSKVSDIVARSAERVAEIAQKAALSREYILTELVNDFEELKEIKPGGEIVVSDDGGFEKTFRCSFGDTVRAKQTRVTIAKQLCEIEGWNAASKMELTGKDGTPLHENSGLADLPIEKLKQIRNIMEDK